jgi:thioredoxin reductase (NADPH)
VLVESGEAIVPFFVITAGQIEVVRPSRTIETLVLLYGPGQFVGEFNIGIGEQWRRKPA